MPSKVYLETRPDYYPKSWGDHYQSQLDLILNCHNNTYLALTPQHTFIRISLIRRIIEAVKGLFGFHTYADSTKVNSELLKFLYYGATHDQISQQRITSLYVNSRPNSQTYLSNMYVQNVIWDLFYHRSSSNVAEGQELLRKMRVQLIDYHAMYSNSLRPAFWSRMTSKQELPILPDDVLFGDTLLDLAALHLDAAEPKVSETLELILKAHELQNLDSIFQEKIFSKLKSFLDRYSTIYQSKIESQKNRIRTTLLQLANNAFVNQETNKTKEILKYLDELYHDDQTRQAVGESFLEKNLLSEAQPYLELLAQVHANNATMLEKIGDAHWHLRNYVSAVDIYKKAIFLHKRDLHTNPSVYGDRIATLSFNIGLAYKNPCEGLNSPIATSEAIQYFSVVYEHYRNGRNHTMHEKNLYAVYLKQWKQNPTNFEERFGEQHAKFLVGCSGSALRDLEPQEVNDSKAMLLACIESALKNHRPERALEYLSGGHSLLGNNSGAISTILRLFQENNALNSLEPYLERWNRTHHTNPIIKEVIAKIYWGLNNKSRALELYEEAIPQLEALINGNDADIKPRCQELLYAIRVLISEHLLTLPEASIPYDRVVRHLTGAIAFRSTPTLVENLYRAYLGLGNYEESKGFTYNVDRAIEYFSKAYATIPRNDPYLQRLFVIYIDQNKKREVVDLYLNIRRQSWANIFALPPNTYFRLASFIKEIYPAQTDEILHCLTQAYQADRTNVSFKGELCKLLQTLAMQKMDQAALTQNEDEKMRLLEAAIEFLKKGFLVGFVGLDARLEPAYKKSIIKAYYNLAEALIQKALIPSSIDTPLNPAEKVTHFESFGTEIQKALDSYNAAQTYTTPNTPLRAAIHFNKALILELIEMNPEKARVEYLAADQHNPNNHFYLKQIANYFKGIDQDTSKTYLDRIPASTDMDTLSNHCREFNRHYYYRVKAFNIDPHTYKITPGGIIRSPRVSQDQNIWA